MQDNSQLHGAQLEELTLLDYISILKRYKWPICILVIVSVVTSAIVGFLMEPEYDSTVTLITQDRGESYLPPQLESVGQLLSMFGSGSFDYEALLKSRRLALKVADKVDLVEYLSRGKDEPPAEPAIAAYLKKRIKISHYQRLNQRE